MVECSDDLQATITLANHRRMIRRKGLNKTLRLSRGETPRVEGCGLEVLQLSRQMASGGLFQQLIVCLCFTSNGSFRGFEVFR